MLRQTLIVAAVFLSIENARGFEFKDGDRVVLIGSTLIEREQRYGYWEAELISRNPDKNITFRNLGWSGDTVWGEARAGFDSVAEGYRRLVEHVRAEKPTVIIVGYGTNESFAGSEGLPKFEKQLRKLLDDLSSTNARFILLSPLERQLASSDSSKSLANILEYSLAIRTEAERRKAAFVNLSLFPADGLDKNGMHLAAYGYWSTAKWLFDGAKSDDYTLTVSTFGITKRAAEPIHLKLTSTRLPIVYDKLASPKNHWNIEIKGLDPGRHTLQRDGKDLATASAEEWARGRDLPEPDVEQAEMLRQTIIAKNELYFNRWRPENVTYLFGFRKHEQGQNAREIPQFDPLIEAKEKEIAKLRKPPEHVYEIVPAKEK